MNIDGKKKVLCAMSGGVDSSVAAALLVEQGYDVTGAFMKNFSPESWAGIVEGDCPWEVDQRDAQAVCDILGISFLSLNFEKEYKAKVIEYFFREYESGRTPNPDVMCNKVIKFGIFLDKAKDLGFDYIATGHHARKREIKNQKLKIKNYELLKGNDPKKDQSYFLYTLNQNQLSQTLFPIGEYTKKEVREIARKFRFPNAEKKDSQGLCFVGHVKLKEFLGQKLRKKLGSVVDISGKVIGKHDGVWSYTIGQRKGIACGGVGEPYYVVDKNIKTNTLVVVHGRNNEHIYSRSFFLKELHKVHSTQTFPLECTAKIRYQMPDQKCVVYIQRSNLRIHELYRGLRVDFTHPQFAVTPGQSCVFYDGEKVLGGGIIEK